MIGILHISPYTVIYHLIQELNKERHNYSHILKDWYTISLSPNTIMNIYKKWGLF